MRPPGFEPGLQAWQARVLGHYTTAAGVVYKTRYIRFSPSKNPPEYVPFHLDFMYYVLWIYFHS